MSFPAYARSVVTNDDDGSWPVQGQGTNECGCTAAANALNLLAGKPLYRKDEFVREAGLLFQRKLGGTPSPMTGWLLQRHGAGTHFGNLRYTDADAVLRDLVDRGVPVVVEIGENKVGPVTIYGRHAILLVGYGVGADGATSEYYFVDSEWPLAGFDLHANQRSDNGTTWRLPGNRTIERQTFAALYVTGIYFPVFRTQAEHDAWYWTNIQPMKSAPLLGSLMSAFGTGSNVQSPQRVPLLGGLMSTLITGSNDLWIGRHAG